MFNETCTSDSLCGTNTNLQCINQICTCSNSFWNGSYCGKLYFKGIIYNNNLFWYSPQIESRRTYLQSCLTEQNSFNDKVCSTQQNLICATSGQLAGLCSCQTNFYFNALALQCEAQKLNSDECTSITECRSDLGLNCINNICQCSSEHFWSTASVSCGTIDDYF